MFKFTNFHFKKSLFFLRVLRNSSKNMKQLKADFFLYQRFASSIQDFFRNTYILSLCQICFCYIKTTCGKVFQNIADLNKSLHDSNSAICT